MTAPSFTRRPASSKTGPATVLHGPAASTRPPPAGERNWESISVYTSWGPEPERVDGEERSFTRLWANRSTRVIVLDVPEAARRDLMRFMPDDVPARLGASGAGQAGRGRGRFDTALSGAGAVVTATGRSARHRPPEPGLVLHPGSTSPRAGRRPRRRSHRRGGLRGPTRCARSNGSTGAGRRSSSSRTRSDSARPSRPACCCARRCSPEGRSGS